MVQDSRWAPILHNFRKLLNRRERLGDLAMRGALLAATCAGWRAKARAQEARPSQDPLCPWCQRRPENSRHRVWQCRENQRVEDLPAQGLQDPYLNELAASRDKCVWLRGLIPAHGAAVPKTPGGSRVAAAEGGPSQGPRRGRAKARREQQGMVRAGATVGARGYAGVLGDGWLAPLRQLAQFSA